MGIRGHRAVLLTRTAGLVGLATLAVGCKGTACPVEQYVDPVALLRDHSVAEAWRGLKAEARVEQFGSGGRIRGTVLMFLERPDRVRFDVMTQFGPTSILTSNGGTFQLSDLRENRFVQGPTCPKNIGALLGIEMTADDVLRLLTGTPPLPDATDEQVTCDDGAYRVTRKLVDGGRQEIFYAVAAGREAVPSEQTLDLGRANMYDRNDALLWEATFDKYTDVADAVRLPTKVRFIDKRNGSDTTVRLKSAEVDPSIPEEAFTQSPRPGLSVEEARCD